MADVLLRECLDEMRAHLRANRFAEAFAIGRHILHFYPKHIETYTVMAQLSLATNDLAGANDLLRRVLSADPENIVGLVGMALISEAQDKYDEALWYLERAYEIQTSSDELRGELLRVRELFYGAAPARMELTSGALARVYARQGQYAQAINEYRRLLRTDSTRYDARVGLAETLYRAGRTDEAAQIAQAVMADAPYALKPNLIIGALWTENAVPEGQQFLQRAHQLDPEHRVARDLLGEPFDGAQAPRLPEPGETVGSGEVADRAARGAYIAGEVVRSEHETTAAETEAMRAAVLLSEIEHGLEPELNLEEPLRADLAEMSGIESGVTQPVQQTTAPGTPPADETPQEPASRDATIQETREAERREADQEKPVTPTGASAESVSPMRPAPKQTLTFGERLRRAKSGEGVSSEAIAAAATALATSIALDKTNQLSPTRRAHPAIPKVRPVIRGAQEKLPAWLRLSATPANAPASFDAPPPSTAEQIVPLTPPPEERPEWLVQAEAASHQASISPQSNSELPDWLQTPPAPEPAPPATKPHDAAMPSWLRDETPIETSRASEFAPVEARSSIVALPDWLRDDTGAPPLDPTANQDAPVVTEGWTNTPPDKSEDEPAWKSVLSEEPPPVRAEPPPEAPVVELPTTTQAMPDSATMLQTARDKRANGDLKGALDMYERVMHRRPNYLDQVTTDLQEIVQASGAPTSANRLLGEAYAMVGRFKESLEQYRIAMGK